MTRYLLLSVCVLLSHSMAYGQEPLPLDPPVAPSHPPPAPVETPAETSAAGPETAPAASATHRIGANDVLSISVLHAPELTTSARVSDSGQISLPLLGMVSVAGLTAVELETALESRLRDKYIREPDVTVQITELQSQAVSVMGAVKRPGIFQIRGAKTLLEVLSLAEGLDENAGDSIIVLRRGAADTAPGAPPSPEALAAASFEVPLKALLSSPDGRVNVPIYPGDVVNVQAADIVYVVGAVKKPGAFAVRGNEQLTVLRALALGEGLLPTASKGSALVLRTKGEGEREEIEVDLGDVLKGKQQDLALQAQDVLFVPTSGGKAVARAALDTLTRIVTLRGVIGP